MSWIKLPRSIIKAPVFKDPRTLKVWLWCMLRTAHRPTVVNMVVNHKVLPIVLQTGEFIFSRQKAAADLSIPVTTFGREINKLQAMGQVSIRSMRNFSILTVHAGNEQHEMEQSKQKALRRKKLEALCETDAKPNATMLDLLAELNIQTRPELIVASYQSHLQKKAVKFASEEDSEKYLRQYLLREWV